MKNSNDIEKKSHGLKTLVFYGILVVAVILIALLIRLFSIIEESKFDGKHQFALSVVRRDSVLALMSFEPLTSTLSLLTFSKDQHASFSSLNRDIGVIPDGYIKLGDDLAISGNAALILQSVIFHWNNINTNITLYDLLRLWFYTHKISTGTVYNKKISSFSDTESVDKILTLRFADSIFAAENISIQIVNASGESGLGRRLARVISNLGGNVVSVQTASIIEPTSKIQYFDRQIYTFRKLKSLLAYHDEKLRNKTIAEIVVIIGKDNTNTKRF